MTSNVRMIHGIESVNTLQTYTSIGNVYHLFMATSVNQSLPQESKYIFNSLRSSDAIYLW